MIDLEQYIRAAYPLLWLVTHEESRALAMLTQLVSKGRGQSYDIFTWSHTKGFTYYDASVETFVALDQVEGRSLAITSSFAANPAAALQTIEHYPLPPPTLADPDAYHPPQTKQTSEQKRAIFVLLDMHPWLSTEPELVRHMRDMVESIRTSGRNLTQSVIVLSPLSTVPDELQKSCAILDLPLPDADILGAHVDALVASFVSKQASTIVKPGRKSGAADSLPPLIREEVIQAASGLTSEEAVNAVRKGLLITGNRFNTDLARVVREEKKQLIRKDGILEYFATSETLAQVGGLEGLKPWIRARTDAFSQAARDYGLPTPKGLLLAGVPGCGKSLVAKAIASEFHLPLLRFDTGRVFSSLMGSSEDRVRRVIKVAESMAPVVLWIDEIDKGFSGLSSSDRSDGGTTARTIGTLLTWMQEKSSPVFIVATANNLIDIQADGSIRDRLPPEMTRKGRFDEIFFVDLPREQERLDIWRIHLEKRKLNVANFDLAELVEKSKNWSGAEIEQVVIDAMYIAFADKSVTPRRALNQNDLLEVVSQMHPLAEFDSDRIEKLQAFATTRMRVANVVPVVTSLSKVTGQRRPN